MNSTHSIQLYIILLKYSFFGEKMRERERENVYTPRKDRNNWYVVNTKIMYMLYFILVKYALFVQARGIDY